MEIIVNGNAKTTSATSIAALVAELGMKQGTVLVEHNGLALRASEWAATEMRAGDRIELLKIVAGG